MKQFIWLSILMILCSCFALEAEDKNKEKNTLSKQLETMLKKADLKYEKDDEGYYWVGFSFKEHRSQNVWIEIIDKEDAKGYVFCSGIATIYEKQVDKSILIKILQDNSSILYGGFGIHENILVLRVFVNNEIMHGDIESFLWGVAVRADEMEKEFTDKDEY